MTSLASRRRNNLPAPISSFIGRERELDEIARLLQEHRLITLTGSGGTGKTRLALRAAECALDAFDDGVWFVRLAPLTAPDLVCDTIAKAVAAPVSGSGAPLDLLDLLSAYLSQKRMLLVLDNCEHLLAECARVTGDLLARCRGLSILATSREPLALHGEWVLRVPSLSLPDAAPPLDHLDHPLDGLLDYEGIRLFVERARAAEPSFQLTSVSAAPVVEICRRLDGIPLALELAAGRVRGMGVAYLGARLDDRFRLLTGSEHAGEPRQRTLLAAVDWSYDLLAADERAVLRRLAIFRGSFTAEAAQAVCAGAYERTTADNADAGGRGTIGADAVLDRLTRLVDKSLVQLRHETGRYRLLETIRLYGLRRLDEAGETNFTSRQHFAYYLRLAEDGASQINGPGHLEWSLRLEHEHDNLRAALAWALDAERTDEAARLALGLWRFWRAKTYQREGLRWLERIHEQSALHPLPRALHPRLLNALGVLASVTHRFAEADVYQREALQLWTAAGDRVGMAQALIDLGWQHFDEVKLPQTKQYAVEALALAEATGDKQVIASALFLDVLADLHGGFGAMFGFGPPDAVRSAALLRLVPTLERSLAIWRELGDAGSEASTLALLGMARQGTGDFERAKPVLAESARLHVRLGDYGEIVGTLVVLMNLAASLAGGPEMARDSARIYGVLGAVNERIAAEPSPWVASEPWRKVQAKLEGLIGQDGFERAAAEGKALTTTEFLALVDCITAPATPTEPLSPHPTAPAAPASSGLTARELEVLRLVARGMTNAQVARELTITPRTVNAHLTAIYGKLGVTARAGAIRYAIEHHLD